MNAAPATCAACFRGCRLRRPCPCQDPAHHPEKSGHGASGVTSAQRFARAHPCPVCGGGDDDPRHQGRRCAGYSSSDGRYAYCTREELAGGLSLYGDTGAYLHVLEGRCNCGNRHDGGAPVAVRPTASAKPETPTPTVVRTRRFEIRDVTGVLVAVHLRDDLSDGGKRMWWESPDGTKALPLPLKDVPLYGAHEIARLAPGTPLVVVEGEPARDALIEHGIPAVATVTGAASCPSAEVLRPLLPYPLFIWRDADAAGARHMERVTAALVELEHGDLRRVKWAEAPPGGDAVDFFAAGHTAEDARALLAAAGWIGGSDSVITMTEGVEPERDELGTAGVELQKAEPLVWPELGRAALHGLAGRIVHAIEPYSEADPVAILAHVHAGVGCLLGRGPHALVGHDRHPANEYLVLVGRSAKGRKGTAWSTPRELLRRIDEPWARGRIRTGLSSGEGLIFHVRDPRDEKQPIKKRGGRVEGYQSVRVDDGESDKRLLIIEPELASVLRRMQAESNSLSAVLRSAWDDGDLSTLTKNSPLRATGAHVSIVAHVTQEELVASLTDMDRANGFANRFLFLQVRRSKFLPEGAEVPADVLDPLVEELREVMRFAESVGTVRRDPDARELWASLYPDLSEGEPGLIGAMLARAEAHVLRLSVLYAVLDRSPLVRPEHLQAALAVWDYAETSARLIFGKALGIQGADRLLDAIKTRGPMTREQIRDVFSRNRSAGELDALVRLLVEAGKIRCSTRPPEGGRGRPVTVYELAEQESGD